MKKIPTVIPVVAAALVDRAGQVLLQRRGADHSLAGLWEFPGGKIEGDESPEQALAREIAEELGVTIDRAALEPVGFATDPQIDPTRRQPHLILLFLCRTWSGEPAALHAERISWFAPGVIAQLELCPLDRPLAKALLRAI